MPTETVPAATTVRDRALAFRALHDRTHVLVLPNAWDALSARIVENAGFPAVATTSAAIAWSLGRADGERVTRDEMLEVVARIVAAVRVPVTADLEAGYGDVAKTVEAAIAVGAVGMNLEDAGGDAETPLVDMELAVHRVKEARTTADRLGVAFFVNARTDVYLANVGAAGDRFAHAVARANAFRGAGADGIFVPGVEDARTIAALTSAIDAPLNVLAGIGTPDVAELARIGVARVSLGSSAACAAFAAFTRVAEEVRDAGTFAYKGSALRYADVNALFAGK